MISYTKYNIFNLVYLLYYMKILIYYNNKFLINDFLLIFIINILITSINDWVLVITKIENFGKNKLGL